jgi:hypothetical protein
MTTVSWETATTASAYHLRRPSMPADPDESALAIAGSSGALNALAGVGEFELKRYLRTT